MQVAPPQPMPQRHAGPVLPTIGIVGGGQLARMLAQAAAPLGCQVVILERNPDCPAAPLATRTLAGDWDDPANLLELARTVDAVTLENEFVDAGALAAVEADGHRLLPGAGVIRVVQDKLLQKQCLAAAGLPVARFADAPTRDAVLQAAREFGWPVVLKKRRNGYDGKGNATVRTAADLPAAWHKLGGDTQPLYVEAFCPFTRELAIIITRAQTGAEAAYPVVETVNHNHICHIVNVPAPVSADLAHHAADLAGRGVAAVGGVGSFGVELFVTGDSRVLVNELAPRVHNTGHYTIEACECSQFENHIRAVLGWPLGSTRLRRPAAVMVNLLAAADGPGAPRGLERALAVPGAHIHIYGKARSVRGRKMGHVTALGDTVEQAAAFARAAADAIQFGDMA